MVPQPRVRLQVLSRAMLGSKYSYEDIANELGITEYQVSQVIEHAQAQAEETSPMSTLESEFVAGKGDEIAYSGGTLGTR